MHAVVVEPINAEVVLIDEEEIKELIHFINTNRHNLTKELLITEIDKIGLSRQLDSLRIISDEHAQQSTMARNSAVNLAVTSPTQHSAVSRRIFQAAAADLIRQFLPTEPNPDELIRVLRLTPPTQRIAWTRVLHSIAASFEAMITFHLRPALQRLVEAFTAGDTAERLNTHLVLLNQNVEALDKAIQNVGADLEN